MQMTAEATIAWGTFGQLHREYIHGGVHARMCVAEGAIRSGKTVDNCILAAMYLETCPDKLHVATGTSAASAKLIIGDCNGYGLEHLFRGRSRWGKYKGNDALYIYTSTGEKIVLFAGGAKKNSYLHIVGHSYGLWIATEVNEHYDCDDSRTSFIKVAFGRQRAAKKPYTLWDLNPSHPNHTIYRWHIDKYADENTFGVGRYVHRKFTIYDNENISAAQLAETESQYTVGTVWHRRDLLGQRAVADGLIYTYFADNIARFRTHQIKDPLYIVSIGVDYGASRSKTKFVATGITRHFKTVYVLAECDITGITDPLSIAQQFIRFALLVRQVYGKVTRAYGDYGALGQIITEGINNEIMRQGLPFLLEDCEKGRIFDRIALTAQLHAQDRLRIHYGCDKLITAMASAQWHPKREDERLDDGTTDVDSLDAFEYSIWPWRDEIQDVERVA